MNGSSVAELRQLYDAERANHIAGVKFRSLRSLVGSILLAIVAPLLFWPYWRWLRRIISAAGTA